MTKSAPHDCLYGENYRIQVAKEESDSFTCECGAQWERRWTRV